MHGKDAVNDSSAGKGPHGDESRDFDTPVASPSLLAARHPSVPTLDTPPPPPPDFNPEPDISAGSLESAICAIISSPASHDASPATGPISAILSPDTNPVSTIGGGSGRGMSIPHVESFSSIRPALLALQNSSSALSSRSDLSASGHSASSLSVGSAASDGANSDSAHLADMRDRLIESQGRSAGPSRHDSLNSLDQVEWRVTEATPPIEPVGGKLEPAYEDAEHAWDSVWPTAESIQRATDTSLERHAENTKFPISAPISPFVTPSFSPAVVGRASPAPMRLTSSPPTGQAEPSPTTRHSSRLSDTFDHPLSFGGGRRRSVSYEPPPPLLNSPTLAAQPVSIAKHQRSFSSSSATQPGLYNAHTNSYNSRVIPQSPLASSTNGSATKKTPPASPSAVRPCSPAIRGPRRSLNSASAGVARARGLSVTMPSGEKQLLPMEQYQDPGPSVQHRFSPAAPACERVPSNDDIPSIRDHLPPAITSGPVETPRELQTMDDSTLAPPLYAPLARPAVLRRALSDFDPKPRPATVPSLIRSQSLNAELEKSPKRTPANAEFTSPPPDAVGRGETDHRPKKSPRRSPANLPSAPTFTPLAPLRDRREVEPLPPEGSGVALVDEGDVLPTETEPCADVTFEDEGLTTLERIFLLSKSDFPFHRNYIARVLGDLLYDVDPCESVEYILPLIASFPMDDDEGVRESFAQELHRILWYFYATCRMTSVDEAIEADLVVDGEGDEALLDRPPLSVDFFTPLLGSLLLNSNTVVTEAARLSVVQIIARLKSEAEPDPEKWGVGARRADDASHPGEGEGTTDKSFFAQDGSHAHRIAPLTLTERNLIEQELLQGIVIGMGSLSVELPEDVYMGATEDEMQSEDYIQVFQAQLMAEATAGRATSMNLIGALCEHYTGEEAVAWGFMDEVLRCEDGDTPVRAEGAMALAALAKIVPVEEIPRLIELFHQLAQDESPQVRQSLCIALPALCRRIEHHEDRAKLAVDSLPSFMLDDDVKNSLLDVMGELVYAFHDAKEGPPVQIMQVYMDEGEVQRLGEDWDTVAAFNFPAVCLTLGPARWSEIQPLYHHLNNRAAAKPRRSLAASLHELSKILTPEQCARDLMPVYHACMAESDEIRELVFEHLDIFLTQLPQDVAWEAYLDLAKGWKNNALGGWRAREQLALHISQFYRIFREVMECKVLDMMKDALLDPFAAVRDAATKGIPMSYEVLGDESDIAHSFREALLDLGRSPKYRQRLTFVRCLREFVKPPPNKQAFEKFFLPFLGSLSKDVVDVRLGLAQSVADLFVVGAYYADKVQAPKAMYDLARVLADDESVDVRDTIRNVDLDHLDKHDTVPHEIKSPEVVKRALTPGDVVPDHAPQQVGMGDQSPLSEPKETEKSRANSKGEGVPEIMPESMKQAKVDEHPGPYRQTPESSDISARTSSSSKSAPASTPPTIQHINTDLASAPVSPKRHNRPGRIDRTASSEVMSHLNRMVLRTPTSELPSTLSPFFGMGLGVNGTPLALPLGSPRPGPRTPGGTYLPGLPKTPGSYLSSPSPNEPSGSGDPFASAFATATPERTPEMMPVSPGGSVRSIEGA